MKKLLVIVPIILISMAGFYTLNQATYREKGEGPYPIATVKLGDGSQFKIELYPEEAPNTVNNFIDLSTHHFYDGLKFTKSIPNYLLQTGDPIGNGSGFPGYFIKSECKQNGINNRIRCEVGTVCMARGKKYNTEGSQFFVLLQDDSTINGQYTAFGKVVEGLEILTAINLKAVEDNAYLNTVRINSIRIETFGRLYDKPQVISIYQERSEK